MSDAGQMSAGYAPGRWGLRRTERRSDVVETDVPARIDRLPWSRWHWLVVFALGAVWILDGLEVTIVGAVAAQLQSAQTLALSASQLGLAGSIYVAGAVSGALIFGYLTDRFGRRRLFMITLGLYLIATCSTAFSQNFLEFALARFFTGAGIGGEYSAINSAIDELIPARVRGWVDLAINGSYWVGTAIGAAASIVLLNPKYFAIDTGWRIGFGIGATLALGVLLLRQFLPESPRWLMTHGKADEAERVVSDIEQKVDDSTDEKLPEPEGTIEVRQTGTIGFGPILKAVAGNYRRRSVLGFSLMVSQAFLYNAIFFTYALVLSNFYSVSSDAIGWYLLPFAAGNFLGPLLLGRLFDVVGRRIMISSSYIISGLGLIVVGWLFQQNTISATELTIGWSLIFFFASAGASAAYLTVSEIFPMESRAMAIAFFYAIATGIGGIIGPALYGHNIATGSRTTVFYGYLLGAGLMIVGGLVEVWLGVDAEQRQLEDVATPLTADRPQTGRPTSG
ncbi:MAG TPA: MFS transporter [Gaiellales bacterium]|jgi:MFS family permease|nr:MFS transporter [Gaiellales bacterium]